VPVVGAVPVATQSLAATPASRAKYVPMPRPPHTVELGAFKSMMDQQSWVPGAYAEVDPLVVELRDGLLMDHTVTL